MKKIINFPTIKRIIKPKAVKVEVPEDITDEIEKSLWELKYSLDIPTEEVEISLETRKNSLSYKK